MRRTERMRRGPTTAPRLGALPRSRPPMHAACSPAPMSRVGFMRRHQPTPSRHAPQPAAGTPTRRRSMEIGWPSMRATQRVSACALALINRASTPSPAQAGGRRLGKAFDVRELSRRRPPSRCCPSRQSTRKSRRRTCPGTPPSWPSSARAAPPAPSRRSRPCPST